MERIMNDAKTLRTSLLSRSTSSEITIGDDVFLMEELWVREDNYTSTQIWLRKGSLLKIVDDATKEWLISAVEAHERAEVPF
tara:strand:+ start:1426 stop:1671 length:246 start_codon:yes stop_codon:yes gene_type:complete